MVSLTSTMYTAPPAAVGSEVCAPGIGTPQRAEPFAAFSADRTLSQPTA
jgi:hypothetical protein